MSNTFVEKCLTGEVLLEDIDDYVDAWHDNNSTDSLSAFLGFSDDEYRLWVERPESLRFIFLSRRTQLPLLETLALNNEDAVAARADSQEEAAAVLQWLRLTGRV